MVENVFPTYFDRLKTPEYRYLYYDEVVKCSLKGGASLEMAQSLLILLYSYYKEDYTEEFIESQVNEIHEGLLSSEGYKKCNRNIQQEVENLIDFRGDGIISLADFYADLKLDGKEDKAACRMSLNRLSARGKIEKIESGRTGTYRLINNNADETKFLTGDIKKFPIKLPLDLNSLCVIYPKSIIVIAGSKSSGKTAICLATALLNQHHLPVVYLNSDMGDEEYTARMLKMGCAGPEDVKFKIFSRASNFHDLVTNEKKLFVIDFLEVHENFYEIGKPIKQIWDKLKDGVAIIAIQMKAGAKMGRGGDFSKEKARLYLSMDYLDNERCTQVRIEEAKSPAAAYPDGVRGWTHKVKIINGSRFSPMDNWHG